MLDREVIVSLLKQFLEQREQYLSDLKSALSNGEWLMLKEQAHRLKGAAVNLRVYGIRDPALDVEKYAEARKEAECAEKIALIEKRFDQLETLLKENN